MTTTAVQSPRQNHLLDALPTSDYERLAPHLELIPMTLGDVLYESWEPIKVDAKRPRGSVR